MKQKDNKTEILATKLTPGDRRIFEAIAQRLGIKGYSFLNLMVSSVIKYSDEQHQLDPTLEKAVSIYESFQDWNRLSSLVGIDKANVHSAIYLFTEPGKTGQQAVLVEPAFFDQPNATFNAQKILDTVMLAALPHMYKRLKAAGRELECRTTLETISTLIEMYGPDPDGEYIRQLFSDCRRSEYGRPVDQQKYVQHKNMHNINNYDE